MSDKYHEVFFSKTVKKPTHYGNKQYLEKRQRERGIIFGFENVEVNHVYFDKFRSGKRIPQPSALLHNKTSSLEVLQVTSTYTPYCYVAVTRSKGKGKLLGTIDCVSYNVIDTSRCKTNSCKVVMVRVELGLGRKGIRA